MLSLWLGPQFFGFGFGFLLALVIFVLFGQWLVDRVMERLEYSTFILH